MKKISKNVGVKGYYTPMVIRNKGKPTEYTEHFPDSRNLILNQFLTQWAAGAIAGSGWRFFVGTGSTAPEITDTQLVSILGGASNQATVTTSMYSDETGYYCRGSGTAQFNLGAIIGNISEVGVTFINSTSHTTIGSRALFKDTEGASTTITLTAEDQLVINYTLDFKIPEQPTIFLADFEGVPTTCTLETLGALIDQRWGFYVFTGNAFNVSMNTAYYSATQELFNNVEAAPTGLTYNSSLGNLNVVDNGIGSRKLIIPIGPTVFNSASAGIKYIGISSFGTTSNFRQGMHFDPPIPKDATKTLRFEVAYNLSRL